MSEMQPLRELLTDEDWILYYQEPKGQRRVVIPNALIPTVLTFYHDIPFTLLQGVSRTLELIGKTYKWDAMRQDTTKFIKECRNCA
jgi:hypothetical protein